MKINDKILSIPPYISTSWRNIASLFERDKILVVQLKNGAEVAIPDLPQWAITEVFQAYEHFIEHDEPKKSTSPISAELTFGMPFRIEGGPAFPIGSMMQHDSAHKNAPNLPEEILQKIILVMKAMGIDGAMAEQIPTAEPHCNCPYCQIARTLQQPEGVEKAPSEEESISLQDLSFRDWEISRIEDKLYRVTNPLNANEQYQVFLGNPIACTCGDKGCEHLKAVLNS